MEMKFQMKTKLKIMIAKYTGTHLHLYCKYVLGTYECNTKKIAKFR